MDIHEHTRSSVIGAQLVPEEETSRYGIIDHAPLGKKWYQVNDLIEKPPMGMAPSTLAIMGRYVLTPEIFTFLEKQEIGAGGEIQLTDAIRKLNEQQAVSAYEFEGRRYDVGEKAGFVKTTLAFALQHEDIREEIIDYLKV